MSLLKYTSGDDELYYYGDTMSYSFYDIAVVAAEEDFCNDESQYPEIIKDTLASATAEG